MQTKFRRALECKHRANGMRRNRHLQSSSGQKRQDCGAKSIPSPTAESLDFLAKAVPVQRPILQYDCFELTLKPSANKNAYG